MAVNRKKPPVEIPAPSDSSTEAEDSSSSGEEEQQQEPQPTLKPQQHQQEDVDDEDDDDEEEEESDEPEKAAATVTPASKKPQSESESESEEEDDEESDSEDDGKAIKLSSVSDFAVKVNKSPEPATVLTKRAAENAGSSNNNKKAKVVSDGDGKIAGSAVDDSKKSVNRVWSENDEIRLLEGFHAFITKNGSDSITNLSAFHDTLEDLDLSLDVTKTRLYDKLRGLKNKYLNNVKREHTVFSKPHEEKLYKISEKIWGGEVGVVEESGSKKSKRNKKVGKKSVEKDICKMDEADDVKKDAGSSFPRLGAFLESQASTYLPMTAVDPKEFANNMVLKFEKKKAKELEEEWKEYSLMESQLYAKRLKIMSKQSDLLLDVLKRSNLN